VSTQTRMFAPEARHYSPSASVSISGERLVPLVIVLAILCGVSIGLTAFAFTAASNAEREARMLEYYVMELDGKLMSAGVIESTQSYSAKKRKE
jgi:hypothetical protein